MFQQKNLQEMRGHFQTKIHLFLIKNYFCAFQIKTIFVVKDFQFNTILLILVIACNKYTNLLINNLVDIKNEPL